MDHKAWLATVPADRRLTLTEKRDGPGLLRLGLHLAGLLVFGALIAAEVLLWPIFLVPQAVLIICLFHLEHEATHGTPFKTRWLNRWAGHFAGFVLLLPFHWFTAFHMAHHKWTNIPGKDPELGADKPQTVSDWLWHVSGLPTWGRSIALFGRLVLNTEQAEFLPDRMRRKAVQEARLMALGYALFLAVLPWNGWIFWVWIVPALLGQPLLRLYLLAEHGDLPHVANMFQNTRTTYTNRLIRWLTWNMPYHTEHHVWPNVPFHALPELHADMSDALNATAGGYAEFSKAFLSRRLHKTAGAVTPE